MSQLEDIEKSSEVEQPEKIFELEGDDLNALGEREGYVLDAGIYQAEHAGRRVKTAADERTILIPQPSDDPNDPLNWNQEKKNLILFIISAASFLPNYGAATGGVTLLPQSAIWNMSPDEVNHSLEGNIAMIGLGSIVVPTLASYFGRLPTTFWFLLFAFWTAAWCAGANTFNEFMAARILNGFFSTVSQANGLVLIKDMFFFHEHARKINIWTAFLILSPYFGPLVAAFIISTQSWQIAFWTYTAETGLCLVLVILFVDETYYNRRIPRLQQPERKSRLLRLVGVEQYRSRWQRSSFAQAVMRPIKVISKPTVFISASYHLLTFAWVVGINSTLAIVVTPLYDFGARQIGFFYFTPIVAAILGEIVGHWLHDLIANGYARRHGGHLEPEARLAAVWLATPFLIGGLVALGFCLNRDYHYMLASLSWGLYVFGIMITTAALNAYNLDSYSEGSGEIAGWLNFARTTGGFIVSYFQVRWVSNLGAEISFAMMGAICAASFLLILILQIWGKRMRQWSGDLHFKTS